ncbi:hypothetical protein LL06_16405 [Hoeflea sp. BAL378]|uniref:hypothetical protein n=1 Tax=Hoeflea sp. BAL378 TaxID=1547437 RepID=UPI0005139550|nr:hypothetical protein [Hoeflea sp. BAL378]KGF68473.1 hypothetical protein LL06_16405 [Hoeflea sp. BAL378]
MSDQPTTTDQTLALLKIQGLLAAAYDMSRHTDNKFLSYLIKMARMEVQARFETPGADADELDKPGKLDRT